MEMNGDGWWSTEEMNNIEDYGHEQDDNDRLAKNRK